MVKNLFLSLSITSLLFLTACVSREQADAKLVKGCKAAVELYLEDGYSIKEIKDTKFSNVANTIDGDRKVTLTVLESDGWYETDKTYSCNFAEQFGAMKTSYSAEIYQVDANGNIYGKKDGNIIGGFNEWSKITGAVADAMN